MIVTEPQVYVDPSSPYYGGHTPQASYPPTTYSNNVTSLGSRTMVNEPSDPQRPARSPSPSPSELEELAQPLYDFAKYRSKEFWLRWKAVPYYLVLIAVIVLFALIYIYHKQVVAWLTPAANWMKNLRFGVLIPIAIFFVLSFPPLFGHEILAIICGVVWGLGLGFAIVCAGTFVGEIGNFYAFKFCCRARAEKWEKTKPFYASFARVVREGGFKIALIARLSAIPGHFTTAVFSTCGMGIFTFCLAAVLSLPKQFVIVYLGVLLDSAGSTESAGERIASIAITVVTTIITFGALKYIYRQMKRVWPVIVREKRRARQAARTPFPPDPSRHQAIGSETSLSRPQHTDPHQPPPAQLAPGLLPGSPPPQVFAPPHQGGYP